mgnify:FL=1
MAKKAYRVKKIVPSEEKKNKETEKPVKVNITKSFAREIKLLIFSIFLMVVMAIAGTYSIFTSTVKEEDYNTMTVGTLKIDYLKDDTNLTLNGAYPISDEDGLKSEPYTFKITNSGSLNASYKVRIVDDQDIINEDKCQDKLLSKSIIKISINDEEPVLLENLQKSDFTVASGTLNSKGTIDYKIRIWIDESATNTVLGKHFHAKVVVDSVNLNTVE